MQTAGNNKQRATLTLRHSQWLQWLLKR